MKYIRNFLILFATIVNGNTFCMEPQEIASHFIAQDSRTMEIPLNGAFGTFLSEAPVVQYTAFGGGTVNQYRLTIVPQALEQLPENFQFSVAELGFHNLLHNGGADALFLTFINDLKSAGARYFVPHGFEAQIGTIFKESNWLD